MKKYKVAIKSSLAAMLFMTLSFQAWSLAIGITSFAPIFLLPLCIIIYWSAYRLHMDVWRAHYALIVRSDAIFYNLVNGKVLGHLGALVFTLASVPVLAWFLITESAAIVVILCIIIASACIMFFSFKNNLILHFKEPFATKYAVNFATAFGAGVSFLILWWYGYAIDKHEAEFQSVDLIGAIELGKSSVPNSNGIFAPLLMWPFILEALKLWAVVQLKAYYNLALIMSLEFALVGFLVARLCVIVTYFVDKIMQDPINDAEK